MPTIDPKISLLLATGTALAMLVVTGWQGYQFWQAEAGRLSPTTMTQTIEQARPETTPPDITLAELALFGSAAATDNTSPTATNTENLPETNLRLTLRGALAADGEFPGSALIEDSSGETDAYLVGDSLPGNAVIRTVLPNRVIIERDGKLENLYFPETENRQGIDLASDQQTAPATPAPQTTSSPASSPDAGSASDEQARRAEIRQRLQQLRQRLQDNN